MNMTAAAVRDSPPQCRQIEPAVIAENVSEWQHRTAAWSKKSFYMNVCV